MLPRYCSRQWLLLSVVAIATTVPTPTLALRPTGLEESESTKREVTHALLQGRVAELLELGQWDALMAVGPDAVDPLLHLLRTHRQWMMRVAAARMLGRLGDARAVKPLHEIATAILSQPLELRGASDGDILLEAALEALGQIHDPRAAGDLLHILQRIPQYFPVQDAALKAAAGIKEPEVAPLVTAFMVPESTGQFDQDVCLLLGTTDEAWSLSSVPLDPQDRAQFASVVPLMVQWFEWAFGVSPAALHAFFTLSPDAIANLPAPAIVQDITRRLAWLPPVGGKLLTDASESVALLDHSTPPPPPTPFPCPPSWTAEEQATAIVQLQRRGFLSHGFIHQMTIQGRLPDAFKYTGIALVLASPYGHDWTHPFFKAVWGRIGPLIHDGGRLVGNLNPLWQDVAGRTDFLYHLASVQEEGAQPVEARLFRDGKAYQRLALALHCAQGTAPVEIPEPVRRTLAAHWNSFVERMNRLLGEFDIQGIAQVRWFLDTPRKRRNWDDPRYEAPWPPIQRELRLLEERRRDQEYARTLRVEAERILEEFTTAIDHDLGLLPESATGLEEVPVDTVM
ncbi:MAG: HEAT repeat domain-containing protein, partial [Candidatus Omnitrophica bacterium]|nr:HEAT repeat domain-containing protein [Candidatus Omnitrophota bacterium]